MTQRARLIACCLLLAAGGCATTGPAVQNSELLAAQAYYEAKAKRHAYRQLVRVHNVGERLLGAIGEEKRSKQPHPYIGVLLDKLTLPSARAFGILGFETEACLVAGIVAGSPAEQAGLQPGDLLLKVNENPTPSVRKATSAFNQLAAGMSTRLALERQGEILEKTLVIGKKPYPVGFAVVDSEEVNAFATPSQIVVSSGMLRFVSSDDELAVVLAHELAHLTEGHYTKKLGTGVVTGPIHAITGINLNPFSRDFEREADYVGLTYAHQAGFDIEAGIEFWDRFATELPGSLSISLFNSHPSSPERLLLLKETIREIKGG